MSIGYNNRKKQLRHERKRNGQDPFPMRNHFGTPKSARFKQLERIWAERAS